MYLQQLDYFIKRMSISFYILLQICLSNSEISNHNLQKYDVHLQTHIFSNVIDGEIRIFFNIIISVTLKVVVL
jgi:hypothetical protein